MALPGLLDRLEKNIGGARRLAGLLRPHGLAAPRVYFFREEGESRSDSGNGPRIVDVSTRRSVRRADGTGHLLVLARLSPEERLVCVWKKAGYSSLEIAQFQGRSVAAVDTLFSRAKQKLRRALGVQDTGRDDRQLVRPVNSQAPEPQVADEDTETDDGTTRSAP